MLRFHIEEGGGLILLNLTITPPSNAVNFGVIGWQGASFQAFSPYSNSR